MTTPSEYDDIRPFNTEELPKVFNELEKDPMFRDVAAKAIPNVPFKTIM